MYYGSGTVDRSATVLAAAGRRCVCTHQMATLMSEMTS